MKYREYKRGYCIGRNMEKKKLMNDMSKIDDVISDIEKAIEKYAYLDDGSNIRRALRNDIKNILMSSIKEYGSDVMTKDEYCKLKGIHFCKPKFNPNDEADEEFKNDIDEILDIVNSKE